MTSTIPRQWELPDGHATAERRSLAMHRAIAARLDAPMLDRARARVATWLTQDGPVDRRWAEGWRELLDGSVDEVAERLIGDTTELAQLRQTTPFAGVLSPTERWAILREVW